MNQYKGNPIGFVPEPSRKGKEYSHNYVEKPTETNIYRYYHYGLVILSTPDRVATGYIKQVERKIKGLITDYLRELDEIKLIDVKINIYNQERY